MFLTFWSNLYNGGAKKRGRKKKAGDNVEEAVKIRLTEVQEQE